MWYDRHRILLAANSGIFCKVKRALLKETHRAKFGFPGIREDID